jgi:hypothetical protein
LMAEIRTVTRAASMSAAQESGIGSVMKKGRPKPALYLILQPCRFMALRIPDQQIFGALVLHVPPTVQLVLPLSKEGVKI